MSAKIVYYGPGLCGKTTSLKYVFHHTRPDARGKMVSLATETDRTLFFDLLPLEVGKVAGFHTRIQLYTVPGQVFYNSTRRLVLKGVDGIVFVADSQPAMLPSNVESFRNLEVNLAELGIKIDEIPLVLQYNKRDLPEVCSVEELREALNTNDWPEFETSALAGTGIFEVLREVSKLTLVSLKQQLEDGVPDTPRPLDKTPPLEEQPSEQAIETPTEATEEPAEAAAEPDASEVDAAALSDDDIEDSALAQLEGGEQESAAAQASDAEPADDAATRDEADPSAPEVEAVAPMPEDDEPAVELDLDADLEAAPEEPAAETTEEDVAAQDAGALAQTNGRNKIDRALSLALQADDLERAASLSLDLQVRDERDRVLHQVRDFEWSLADIDRLQNVLLNLKIELESEDS